MLLKMKVDDECGIVFTAWTSILVLVVAIMVAGLVGCGEGTADTSPDTTHKLTHSAADAEYILGWDLIVSQCPDIGSYDRIEAFAHRGESVEIAPGENLSVDQDSPAAWASTRLVRTEWEGKDFRSFAVQVIYCETQGDLDELVQMLGLPVEQEGEFVTAALESETPMQSIQLLLAGKHFAVVMGEFASLDESLFFDKEGLEELLSVARSKISMLEATPLPPEMPEREG
jgi:hypothetical protein